MKKKIILLLLCAVICMISVCGCAEEYSQKTLFALDTYIDFKLSSSLPAGCAEFISRYESLLSKTVAESEIYKINHAERFAPSEETYTLLLKSWQISDTTKGAFDFTCGKLVEIWNVNSEDAQVPTQAQIDGALSVTGYEKTELKDGQIIKENEDITVDLGGIAKGYIAEKTVEYLKEQGVEYGIVSFGGNIATVGEKPNGKPWIIGIKDPLNTSSTLGNFELKKGFLSVSGGYERYFTSDGIDYHHIINTKTGYPSESDLLSVAVLCGDGALADALSTALFVMGLEEGMKLYESGVYEFDAVFVTKDKKIILTENIKNTFTLTNSQYSLLEK